MYGKVKELHDLQRSIADVRHEMDLTEGEVRKRWELRLKGLVKDKYPLENEFYGLCLCSHLRASLTVDEEYMRTSHG